MDINDIYKQSSSFVKPKLFKKSFNNTLFGQQDILELFKTIKLDSGNQKESSVRVYFKGGLNPYFEDKIKYGHISEEQTISEHLKTIFKDEDFGIIINKAERWTDKISNKIADLFKSFNESQKHNYEYEITLFVGNYGYTPFGVHIDDSDTTVIHFHLGAGTKEMYLMEKTDFIKYTDKSIEPRRSFNYDSILDKCNKFEIAKNDIFILPSDKYHVGYTPEFSIGLALAVIDKSEEKVDINYNLFKDKSTSIQNALERSKKHKIAERTSKGYFQGTPFVKEKTKNIVKDSILICPSNFPITYIESDDSLFIYIRGTEVKIQNFEIIKSFIDFINSKQCFKYSTIHEKFNNYLEEDVIKSLLHSFISSGGLKFAK